MKNNLFTPNLHQIIVPGYNNSSFNNIAKNETRNLSKNSNFEFKQKTFNGTFSRNYVQNLKKNSVNINVI